jgi:hypothetical protein
MEWIKCNNRMPEMRTSVLVYARRGYSFEKDRKCKIYTGYWIEDYDDCYIWKIDCDCSGPEFDSEKIDVLSWMPLPKPP